VDCVGDLDANAYDDVHVGADGAAVYEFRSNSAGPAARPGWTRCIAPPLDAAGFGLSIHGTGRMTSDTNGGFAIGAPGSSGAYFYLGAASGAATTPPTTTFPGPPGSGFGHVVN
ncbi:MAG: hypothetical protein WCJ30_01785, partial [Deltaproteobacteria bacterium]